MAGRAERVAGSPSARTGSTMSRIPSTRTTRTGVPSEMSGPADRADGNEVIIKLLSSTPGAADLATSYISGKKDLELDRYLASYGLILDTSGKSSRLVINNKLDENQKRLLKSLGY